MRHLFTAAILFIFSACTLNNTKIDNSLKKYFEEEKVEGTFAILNNQTGHITLYNMPMDTQQFTPGFTFNALNTLIGVEAGQITGKDKKWMVEGDSISLATAWERRFDPFFTEMAKKSGEKNLSLYIDSIEYGNKNLRGEDFWQNGSLKVSPDEQLGFLFQLYFDKLPFSRFAQEMVRDLMLKENNAKYSFSYVNGAATSDGTPIDWSMGWIEENKHVYFYVTLIKGKSADAVKDKSFEISKRILSDMEFFKGVK